MSAFVEREYQTNAHESIFEAWKQYRSTLLVMATGLGKTVVAAHVTQAVQPGRVMVLAHRDELITQAKDKIEDLTKLSVEVEKAELEANTSLYHRMPVVVSSIQTQISGPKNRRRYLRFAPEDFAVLICDETHHALSPSWREVIAHYQKNPNLKLLGMTATPQRADEEALSQVFESVAFQYDILDAIRDGWLVDIAQQYVPVASLDFSHIRTTAGDLNEADLSKVMEAEENIQGVCQPSLEAMFGLAPKTLSAMPVPQWREYLAALKRPPRRTIIFTVSVAQAEMCANIFSRAIDGVEWVCGKTNKDKRRAILGRFANGETHAVANCGVLTEGFDNAGVEVIVMARPTKSKTLYLQAIGRATRPLPGVVDGIQTAEGRRAAIAASAKPIARILDFVGNSGRHKIISCVDVLAGKVSEEAREQAKGKAILEGKPVRIMVTMDNAELELERKKQEAAEKARREWEARKNHLVAKVDYEIQNVPLFSHEHAKVVYKPTTSRDGRTFSEAQTAVLRRAGYDPSKYLYRQGQALIGKIKEAEASMPATPRQKGFLRWKKVECENLTKREASKLIEKLKAA